MNLLSDKTPNPLALVTGAAHRLGRELALELAQRGYAIAVHYHHSRQKAENTLAEIQAIGVPAFLFEADLTNPEEIIALFAQIDALPHPFRLLVNSAALMFKADLQTITPEEWDNALAINLRAPLLCAQQAAKRMGAEGGLIVNITDAGAQRTWTGFPAYVVSKTALEALTRLLARSLAPLIRVNAIAPGLIFPPDAMPDGDWQRLVTRLPLRRKGEPEEIRQALAFLLSDPYITGQTIVVDGGYQLI